MFFLDNYIAIANNPSEGIQNGDNIRAENCHVKRGHTFWSAGQTQSRSNSIDNIYGLTLHTFVSGNKIGRQQGTIPSISNVNLAGFVKQLLNVGALFGPVRVSDSYFESLWSLGYAAVNNVSFDQCQIKFRHPSKYIYAPPYHLYAVKQATFRDCSIEYFNNCSTKAPILFKTNGLTVSGGFVEGGVIVSGGINSVSGGGIHNVKIDNMYAKCLGTTYGNIGNENFTGSLKLTRRTLMGGEKIKLSEVPMTFTNNSNSYYHSYEIDPLIEIAIDTIEKKAKIKVVDTGRYQLGDNIFTANAIHPSESNIKGDWLRTPLGFISSIQNNTITVSAIPKGRPVDKIIKIRGAHVVSYPKFIQPIWGNFTEGSNVITNVVASFIDNRYRYPGTDLKIFNITMQFL